MAQGIKALRKLQMGKEDTAGTAVAATAIFRGVTGTILDNTEVTFPEEDIGYISGIDRSYIAKTEAGLSLGPMEATFEQLPYILNAGIYGATATTDETGGGIFTYNFPEVTSDYKVTTDLFTYTFEGGDNAQAEEFAYGFVSSFNLSGDAAQALMMSAEIIGRQVAPTSDNGFTGSISIPSVEEILFSKGKLYIDPITSSTDLGQTQVSNQFLSMDFSVNTGWIPVYTADGNIYFSFVKSTPAEIVLTITFEHNTSAIAEKAYWKAQTARQIRLEFDGSAATKELLIDMAGKWDNFEKIGERDGNDIVSGTFRARYNATCTRFCSIVCRNNLASLP